MNIFITGISTDVGKTVVSATVVEALCADYWKPIQAGDIAFSDTHKVKALISNTKTKFFPSAYALSTPASPHYSAAIDGIEIRAERIVRPVANPILVIEGAGGLLVPINDTQTIADLIHPEDYVIVVSQHYLGSINHTLLTYEALKHRGISKVGVIFNGGDQPSSRQIILSKTNWINLGTIDKEDCINSDMICKYASILKPKLMQFLKQ